MASKENKINKWSNFSDQRFHKAASWYCIQPGSWKLYTFLDIKAAFSADLFMRQLCHLARAVSNSRTEGRRATESRKPEQSRQPLMPPFSKWTRLVNVSHQRWWCIHRGCSLSRGGWPHSSYPHNYRLTNIASNVWRVRLERLIILMSGRMEQSPYSRCIQVPMIIHRMPLYQTEIFMT